VGSAVLAYDAQIAAAGITTAFDWFLVGVEEYDAGGRLGEEVALLAEAVRRAADANLLRADHLTHRV
jgi:alpha-D-ribose 1-methylphosphonate 5-triphosphate diphosphatase